MIDYQYTYIIGNIILLLIWTFLFIRRKDTRKEMLVISIIFGIAGPIAEMIYIKDWWQPLTITGTSIGIEDFLFGFLIGGIMAVIYEHLFQKRIQKKKPKKIHKSKIFRPAIVLLLLFVGLYYLTSLNSFTLTVIALLVPTIMIWIQRKDLIKNSIFSGILAWVVAVVGYTVLNVITPGFFEEFWYFTLVGKIIFLGIPIEEHIWFLLAGAFVGPLYEYWRERKLIDNR